MRQFFTWQFWLPIAALGALLLGALAIRGCESSDPVVDAVVRPVEHRVDLIATVVDVQRSADFAVDRGVTVGELVVALDGGRRVTVVPGTPLDQRCSLADASSPTPATETSATDAPADAAPTCAFAADLLGDAVVWAALFEAPARSTVDLAPVVEVRDDGWTLLRNGWELQRASVVERVCDADTASLVDFVRRFGPLSITTFNLARQEIVRVSCEVP